MKLKMSRIAVVLIGLLSASLSQAAQIKCMGYKNSYQWLLSTHFMMKDTEYKDTKISDQALVRTVIGQVAQAELTLERCANGTCETRLALSGLNVTSTPGSFERNKCLSGCINDNVKTKWSGITQSPDENLSYEILVDFNQLTPSNEHVGSVTLIGHQNETSGMFTFAPEECFVILPK